MKINTNVEHNLKTNNVGTDGTLLQTTCSHVKLLGRLRSTEALLAPYLHPPAPSKITGERTAG